MKIRSTSLSEEITSECPCIGHCSTVLGDDVCRGCQRTLEEVIGWPQMSEEERMRVNVRIAAESGRIIKR